MQINTTCPACGSQMSLSTGERTATCGFCGTRYEVDFSQTEPGLKVIQPEEMTPEPLPVQSAESESIVPEPPKPVFEPAMQYEPPPPPSQPLGSGSIPAAPARRNPTWIVIAILVMGVVCTLCACLALFAWNYSAR